MPVCKDLKFYFDTYDQGREGISVPIRKMKEGLARRGIIPPLVFPRRSSFEADFKYSSDEGFLVFGIPWGRIMMDSMHWPRSKLDMRSYNLSKVFGTLEAEHEDKRFLNIFGICRVHQTRPKCIY